jgi:hypothetical protein
MSIIAFGDKHPSFLRKTRSEILLRPPRLHGEHKIEEVGEAQSQDDEMREEQSEMETAESVEETCKRQGYPIVGIVRALTFTKSLSSRNKKQHAASAIDEIEVSLLKEDSTAAADTENEKELGEKKTVTFAEEVRVSEFEVDRTKKTRKKTRRQRCKRRAHDDDESDDDEPLSILSCALPLPLGKGYQYHVNCGLGLKRDNERLPSTSSRDQS